MDLIHPGRTDIHFHALPGVDDGPATMEDSLELARLAVRDGTRTVVATPHIRREYLADPSEVRPRVAELQDRLRLEASNCPCSPAASWTRTWWVASPRTSLTRSRLGRPARGGSCSRHRSRDWRGWSTPQPSCVRAASASCSHIPSGRQGCWPAAAASFAASLRLGA